MAYMQAVGTSLCSTSLNKFEILLFKNFLAPVVESNKVIGIVSYDKFGLPQVCTLLSSHREFTNNPRVSVQL